MRLTSSYLNEVTVTNDWRCSLATRLPILASGLVTLAGHYDARTFRSRVYEYYDPEVSSVARPVQLEVRHR
jgi:esterase/lipase superfamily enzyme